jgi:hypothetical protein
MQMNDQVKNYCHLLNSTLTATERTLCCILENYQTAEGVRVPEVLQPFMLGIEFLPFTEASKKDTKKDTKKDPKPKNPPAKVQKSFNLNLKSGYLPRIADSIMQMFNYIVHALLTSGVFRGQVPAAGAQEKKVSTDNTSGTPDIHQLKL